jgi:flagellar protein FliO/FliZ
VLNSVSLGPQQRLVTVQVGQGADALCLVLGVAPGSIQALHTLPLPAETDTGAPVPTATAGGFAARLAQLTAPKTAPSAQGPHAPL